MANLSGIPLYKFVGLLLIYLSETEIEFTFKPNDWLKRSQTILF